MEKFWRWSDCGGDVESRFTKDELLTNVSLYWFNHNITSSTRLYKEVLGSTEMVELLKLRVKVFLCQVLATKGTSPLFLERAVPANQSPSPHVDQIIWEQHLIGWFLRGLLWNHSATVDQGKQHHLMQVAVIWQTQN